MMKKFLSLLSLAIVCATSFAAQTKMEPWQDPNVFEENRMPMRATFVTAEQQTLSLNGLWKFYFNPTVEGRLKGFEAVGYDDGAWDEIPVPGLWDLNGYCDPLYVNAGFPWSGHYENNPPYPALEHNYVGQYRRTFTVDPSWIGKQICLNIGSATSNVRVWVNGKMVGYSEDSKLEARFDLTKYVHAGENLIALEIFRWCDGTYLEDQDFWRFAGISRGVEVYTREKERIEDVHVIGGMDGNLKVALEVTKGISAVALEVVDASGKSVLSAAGLKPLPVRQVQQLLRFLRSLCERFLAKQVLPGLQDLPVQFRMRLRRGQVDHKIDFRIIKQLFRNACLQDAELSGQLFRRSDLTVRAGRKPQLRKKAADIPGIRPADHPASQDSDIQAVHGCLPIFGSFRY